LLANVDPARYERAALRWLQRFIDERLPPLTEVALAASALAELRHGNRNAGVETLKRLLRRGKPNTVPPMRLYALVEAGVPRRSTSTVRAGRAARTRGLPSGRASVARVPLDRGARDAWSSNRVVEL